MSITAIKTKLPQLHWEYYSNNITQCLAALSLYGKPVPTKDLTRYFFNDLPKTRQVLQEMKARGYVSLYEPMYNMHLWSITRKGRNYLKTKLN